MTVLQNKVLCIFRDLKIKQGNPTARIVCHNGVDGVLIGTAEFYTLAAIMDPVNRLYNTPRPKVAM